MTRLPLDEFAASIGIDRADAKHAPWQQGMGSTKCEFDVLEHQPDTIEAWVRTVRYADVITQPRHAIKSATPLTTNAGVIAPPMPSWSRPLLPDSACPSTRSRMSAKLLPTAPKTVPTSLDWTPCPVQGMY